MKTENEHKVVNRKELLPKRPTNQSIAVHITIIFTNSRVILQL